MSTRLCAIFALTFILMCGLPVDASSQTAIPTKVLIRAVSRDAKVIGANVGGARITIREAETGKLLAEGIQRGSTGNTQLIMRRPRRRGGAVYDAPGTAGFLATLHLAHPTVVEIAAEGPLGTPQSKQRATKTILLAPGQDVLGEGILLEIHGFTVTIVTPAPDDVLKRGQTLAVKARVTMT